MFTPKLSAPGSGWAELEGMQKWVTFTHWNSENSLVRACWARTLAFMVRPTPSYSPCSELIDLIWKPSTELCQQRPLSQIRQHSQVPGVKMWMQLFGGHHSTNRRAQARLASLSHWSSLVLHLRFQQDLIFPRNALNPLQSLSQLACSHRMQLCRKGINGFFFS